MKFAINLKLSKINPLPPVFCPPLFAAPPQNAFELFSVFSTKTILFGFSETISWAVRHFPLEPPLPRLAAREGKGLKGKKFPPRPCFRASRADGLGLFLSSNRFKKPVFCWSPPQ